MKRSNRRIRAQLGSAVARWARATVTVVALVAVIATAVATPASAYWTSTGSGTASSTTGTLSAPTGVTVPAAAAPDVLVEWTAGSGGVTPTGYFVTRNDGTDTEPACASSPTTLVAGPACTDVDVPDGTFTYAVTAVYATWTAASSPSGSVTVENAAYLEFVDQPTETLAGTTITPAVTVALRTADGGAYLSAGVAITLAIGANPGGGDLSGTTTVLTDANGVATFDDLAISEPGVGYTLTATSPDLGADTSAAFTVTGFLAAAQYFSILAVTAVTNTGTSTKVSGDVGVSPAGAVTGFTTGQIGGDLHVNDSAAAAAQAALVTAYADLSTRTADQQITALSGLTFHPGVYHSTAALALTTTVTLDADGDPDAVFIFQTDGAFDTAAVSSVILIDGAQAANVYWVVGGAAGTGANTSLSGSILAVGAITLGDGTLLIGRALSRGAVTLTGSTVRFTTALPPTITIDGGAAATTKDTTPTIAGTSNASVGSPVTVWVDGQTLSTTVVSGGTWSVTAAELTASSYDVVARVRDAAGNGTAVSQVLTVEVNPDPVNLGAAESFAVLANPSVTNTDATVVDGDLGVSPGSTVTGFPPGVVNGTSHVNDTEAANAQAALAAAIAEVTARTKHTEITADLGGQTFHLGIHHQTAAMGLTGNVTLDAEDNPDAIFIFVTDAAFNTAALSTVTLANGAQAANVYWVAAGAVGTGANANHSGTILATGAITLGAGTQLAGRALSRGAVTLAGNTITVPVVAGFARMQAMPEMGAVSGFSGTTDQPPASTTDGAGVAVPATETAVAPAEIPPAETPTDTMPLTSSTSQTPPEPMPETPPETSTVTPDVSAALDTSPEVTVSVPPATPPESGTAPGPTTSTSTEATAP